VPPSAEDRPRWFAEEVLPHEPALRSYLRYSLSSAADVDDLAQECFMRVLRMRAAHPVTSPKALLFTIARNAVRDLIRRRRVSDQVLITEADGLCVLDEGHDVVEDVSRRQELAFLADAIATLPERCRQVLLLRKIQGLSQREIAARLGITENTVESLVAKGTRRCGEFLRSRGVEGPPS
jgi:RNA polymerase sigma-70 factor (ECF subfamily)